MSIVQLLYDIRLKIKYLLFCTKHPTIRVENKTIVYNKVINEGIGNVIILAEGASMYNCTIRFRGNNHKLLIESGAQLEGDSLSFEDENGIIRIGNNTTIEQRCSLSSVEGTSICIGDDCMLSTDIDIRTTDSHSILNSHGERINPSQDVTIQNHVWIGFRSTILKGTHIANNRIIGACSLLTSKTEYCNNALFVGSPAQLIKREIDWNRKRIALPLHLR